jgi:uncharacterized FlaG/YvyC family protein
MAKKKKNKKNVQEKKKKENSEVNVEALYRAKIKERINNAGKEINEVLKKYNVRLDIVHKIDIKPLG